ncbi:MAG: hypothetical protein ACE5IK_12265 [Acidobacteriota bacterium]
MLVDRLASSLVPPAVVDSVRNPAEVAALRALGGFMLVAVVAPDALRFARIQSRGRAGDLQTLEEFQLFERRENSGVVSEQRIDATVALADHVVDNAGSLDELRDHVRALLASPRRDERPG